MRRLRCLEPRRQQDLASQFHWLAPVQSGELPAGLCMLSLSAFDHWLDGDEALDKLPAGSPLEQHLRDSLHTDFCARLLRETEVLSFTWRGRLKTVPRFRSFTSYAAGIHYLHPDGARALDSPYIQLALPAFSAAYYQGYDDTWHMYLPQQEHAATLTTWAADAGLHVLT